MDVFDLRQILRDKQNREHGEYRTKRLLLEGYDALAAAMSSGGPGDRRVVHSESRARTR